MLNAAAIPPKNLPQIPHKPACFHSDQKLPTFQENKKQKKNLHFPSDVPDPSNTASVCVYTTPARENLLSLSLSLLSLYIGAIHTGVGQSSDATMCAPPGQGQDNTLPRREKHPANCRPPSGWIAAPVGRNYCPVGHEVVLWLRKRERFLRDWFGLYTCYILYDFRFHKKRSCSSSIRIINYCLRASANDCISRVLFI